MICPKCGTHNSDAALRCTNCLEPLPEPTNDTGSTAAPAGDPYESPAPPPSGHAHEASQSGPFYPQQEAPQGNPYAQQPSYGQPYQQPPKPSTFLAGNIVMTILSLCTCYGLIMGIIGIVFSAMVSSKYNQGDYGGANAMSTAAKIMFFVSLALLALAVILFFVVLGGSFAAINSIMQEFGMYY